MFLTIKNQLTHIAWIAATMQQQNSFICKKKIHLSWTTNWLPFFSTDKLTSKKKILQKQQTYNLLTIRDCPTR